MKHFVVSVLWLIALASECASTPGKLDTSFAPPGNGRVWTVESAANGGVYVARNSLKRFNLDGTEDTRFVCPIVVDGMFASMRVVLADSDGSLLVAGTFSIGSQPVFTARVLPTGAIDPNFHYANFGPPVPASIITSGALDTSGRLLLAGPFQSVDGHTVPSLTRLLPNGQRDESFNPPDSIGFPNAIGVLPDGRIVIGGDNGVVALKPDGSLDNSTVAYAGLKNVSALAVSSSGEIAIGRYEIRLLRSDLTEDTSFSSNFGFSLGIDDLGFDANGRLLASGVFGINPVTFGVVRFLPNGSTDASWSRLDSTDGRIERLQISQSGDVYVSGRFATMQGAARDGVARLHGSTTGATEWTNTSARATIGSDDPLISGFVVRGDETIEVLVRAVGPSLLGFGVAAPLQHPQLAVYSGATRIYETSGWSDTADTRSIQSSVGAFPLLRNSTDSVAVVTLPPGAYTLVITAPKGETGSVLGEVYKVQ